MTDHRAGGTGVGGELDPGARLADVGVVEQLGRRQGDRGGADVGLARRSREGRREAGLARRLVEPVSRSFRLGPKPSTLQFATWKWVCGAAKAPSDPASAGSDGEGIAVGRVEGEVGPVEVDQDRAQAQRDAVEDRGQRIGDRGDLGVDRIDVERGPDDDVAEVIGPGDRRGDDREAERRALVGTGEVDLAGQVERVGAGAGAGGRRADPARGGAGGVGALGGPGAAGIRERGERRVGAVGDAAQRREEAGRRVHRDRAEVLVAVGAVEFEREGAVGPGGLLRVRRRKSGAKARGFAGQGPPFGPERDRKNWVDSVPAAPRPRG